MTEEIIGMDDMMAVYEVTDSFGIDRETISVPLEKEGGGVVSRQPDGSIEITVPTVMPVLDWMPALRSSLEGLGFEPGYDDEDSWPE